MSQFDRYSAQSEFTQGQRKELEAIATNAAINAVSNVAREAGRNAARDAAREVAKKEVDERFSRKDFLDSIHEMVNTHYMQNAVSALAKAAVDREANSFVNNGGLKLAVKAITKEYFADNWLKQFSHHFNDSGEIKGLMAEQLAEVRKTVTAEAKAYVEHVVDNSTRFSPFFDAHLAILSQRNEQKLTAQNATISENIEAMRKLREDNRKLVERLDSQESKLFYFSSIFGAFSVVGGLCLVSKL
jgi:hypothetical protein